MFNIIICIIRCDELKYEYTSVGTYKIYYLYFILFNLITKIENTII